jgi:hypothetical protein
MPNNNKYNRIPSTSTHNNNDNHHPITINKNENWGSHS